MKYKIILSLAILLLVVEVQGQLFVSKVYDVNPWIPVMRRYKGLAMSMTF